MPIFFTYALILTNFYGIPAGQIGWYILPFAAGNVLGPIVLGRLFDTIGRRTMIAADLRHFGHLACRTGYLFSQSLLSAQTLTAAWMIVFFFASAAASSAYLTVSEIFPLEIRAFAIAFFYAIGTGVGGIAGPLAVRRTDRYGIAQQCCAGLCARRSSDDRGRDRPKRPGASPRSANRSRRSPGRCLLLNSDGI